MQVQGDEMTPLGLELGECAAGEAGTAAQDDDAAEPAQTRWRFVKRVRANSSYQPLTAHIAVSRQPVSLSAATAQA